MVKPRERDAIESKIESFIADTEEDHQGADFSLDTYRVEKLNTEECVPWKYHDRNNLWFSGEKAESLAKSINAVGQQQLGLVRCRPPDPSNSAKYEIIFGARRWNACKQNGIHFEARVLPSHTPDSVCAKLMNDENEESENITEFEKAISYSLLLNGKVFDSQSQLANTYGVSKQYVQKLVAASRLIEVDWLNKLFGPVILSLSVKNATKLLDLTKEHKEEKRIKKIVEGIEIGEATDASAISKQILEAIQPKKKQKKKVFHKIGPKPTAVCTTDAKGHLVLKITPEHIEPEHLEHILTDIHGYLENEIKKNH
ncbi:MAG: ParB/RepB/Spo0J family partition protein [Candidatus Sedimenticola sp. (ex Thyasira tokunagai)]